jgi:hypothetical protein
MCNTDRFFLKLFTFEIRGSHSGVVKKIQNFLEGREINLQNAQLILRLIYY